MKHLYLTLLVIFLPVFIVAQHPEWIQFQSPSQTRIFEEQGSYLWAASSAGLYRIEKATGTSEAFNNANSPLPDNFITALESVGDSILWIGTLYGGLAKWQDGIFTVFDTTNSPLYSNRISTLDSDVNGVLWVGSGMEDYDQLGMTARFDGVNWVVFDTLWYPNEIHVQDTNLIWIRRGEEVQTLVKFDGQQIVAEYNPWDWSPGCPWCFESFDIDAYGNKWIQSDSLIKFDDTTFTKYSSGVPMSYGNMHIDTDTIWFPMPEGYARFENETWTFYQKPASIEGAVKVIEIDAEENKWFNIFNKGIYKQTGTLWSEVLTGLPFGYTSCIAADYAGNIWVGSNVGLARYDGTDWTLYDTSNSMLPSQEIVSLAVAGSTVWAGTLYGGLVHIEDGAFTVFNSGNSGLPANSVIALAADQDGIIWTGSGEATGLTSFDGQAWVTYNSVNSSLPDNIVSKIVVDHNNNKWISAHDGESSTPDLITLLDGTTFSTFSIPEDPQWIFNGVSDMAADNSGGLWVTTTYWNGTLEDGNWTIHGNETSYTIYIDPDGTRWMSLNGLARWDGTAWYTFNTTNSGMPANGFSGLTTDSAGTLWIASEGVAAYNPEGFPVSAPSIAVNNHEFRLYPNPATDKVYIGVPANQQITKVLVHDLQGKLLMRLLNTNTIPVSNLHKGLYLIEIETNTTIFKGKLIK